MSFNKGIFTLSIDFEFAWGFAYEELTSGHKESIRKEVEITHRLLAMLDKYEIPATWAIVGHLLETDCNWDSRRPHSDFPRPVMNNEERDWFWQHPKKEERNILWFDTENLIDKIKTATAGHEIASHSYAHIIYGDKKTNAAAVKMDITKARQIHLQNNMTFRAFVFPRNKIGHKPLLKENGIVCYRSNKQVWYDPLSRTFRRLAHILDYYLPYCHTSLPAIDETGLVAIDDSMLLLGRNGLRKLVSAAAIAKKTKNGIKQAIKKKEVFHLWFHPSNFAYDTEKQFGILDNILATVSRLRQTDGSIETLTLSQIAARAK